MKITLPKISGREKDVLAVLWRTGTSLTASGITENGDGLNINTVQSALRSLMKKGFIEVAEIVYSGTVLSRSYKPIVSAEQYAADQLRAMRTNTLNFSTLSFVEHLVQDSDSSILDELEKVIRQKKEQEDK